MALSSKWGGWQHIMGIFILRATATIAWTPLIPLVSRSIMVGPTSGYACRQHWRKISRSNNNSNVYCTSSSGGRADPTLSTTATVSSGEDNGKSRGVEQGEIAEGRHSCIGGVGGAEIQPLLRTHMETLESTKRRKLKARQHVNPLASTFQTPVVMPQGWFQAAYQDPAASLLVDIGCAKGTFLMDMAREHPERNFLGLEIRRPVAAIALARAGQLPTRNCHFVCGNANVDLDALLTEAARHGGSIDTICIQFPDPHFKAKHYKRRVLQPELVTCIEKHLRPGGTLFMQSDVPDVLQDMRTITRETAAVLEDSRPDMDDWMEGPDENPFGVPTERERATYVKESAEENRVYRCVFVKKG